MIYQEKVARFLFATLQNQSIPHGFLFTGMEGVGKRDAAMAYAMACNCLHRAEMTEPGAGVFPERVDCDAPMDIPCGTCRPCRKILSGQHPDIIYVKPSARVIKIAQIRELCRCLAMKPYEAEVRTVIVSDADRLNAEAGNALLKILEEPPVGTIFILTALQASDLLPTIVSRCQQVRFHPIPAQRLQPLLVETYGLDQEQAGIMARMAGGSWTTARKICETEWGAFRKRLLREISALSDHSVSQRLYFAETLCSLKERLPDVLDICQTWFRDLLIFTDAPDKIINTDMTNLIADISHRWRPATLHRIVEAVGMAQRRLQANANARLVMDMLILEMAGG
ncbi:MAG: ATP-binding protein [Thermodesulfobacteriota bacterium]